LFRWPSWRALPFFWVRGAANFLVLAFSYTVLALGHLRSATSPATAVAAPSETMGRGERITATIA
jgi:hypothetical protein